MYYRFWDSDTAKRMAVSFIGWSRRDSRSRGPHTSYNNVNGVAARDGVLLNDAYCTLAVKS